MKFGPDHYVPVLKIKRAEKNALADLGESQPGAFTPLLEVVARKSEKTLPEHIDTTFKGLAESVAKVSPCFIDARELGPDSDGASAAVFKRARADGIDFVPVLGITRPSGNAAGLMYRENGVALRISRAEMEAADLAASIEQFMFAFSLQKSGVDLILDMGYVGDMISVGVLLLARRFMQAIPDPQAWRTFTLSGCAFPNSMGKVGRDAHLLVERSEWVCWKELYGQRDTLDRLPTFSDCAIQHPDGVEGFDPRTMAASAAARYTTGDYWLLVKGESTKKKKPAIQFPQIAERIVTNKHGSHYKGAQHCTGCQLIADSANGAPNLASPEKWRLIGSIHHIATVRQDLSALHWP